MNKETLEKAQSLRDAIRDKVYALNLMSTMEETITAQETIYLTAMSLDESIEIPPKLVIGWITTMRKEKEIQLNQLKKEFEDL